LLADKFSGKLFENLTTLLDGRLVEEKEFLAAHQKNSKTDVCLIAVQNT